MSNDRTLPTLPIEQSVHSAYELPSRYRDLGALGAGSFGDVRRVFDTVLERILAMKILQVESDLREHVRARFLAEAKLTARLQHPGITAVHDCGTLPDGRVWYTMAEVRGRTLRSVLDERVSLTPTPRRLLEVLARVCEAVGFAHANDVIHRDLKPDNVMLGEFGQVLVLDWGVAKYTANPDSEMDASQPRVVGTPWYLSPEQARGNVRECFAQSDVYSLGCVLHHILMGHPPGRVAGATVWQRVATRPFEALDATTAPHVPLDLVRICNRTLAFEPAARHANAHELAAELNAYLDGEQRRERALAALKTLSRDDSEIERLRVSADALRTQAVRALEHVKPSDSIEKKREGWRLEDQAHALESQAQVLQSQRIQRLHSALFLDPELPEAHALLADHYASELLGAERARKESEALRLEGLVRAHDRGTHTAFLRGHGALSLDTEPTHAKASLYQYTLVERRLVAVPFRELGRTPLRDVSLERGSYLLQLRAKGRVRVLVPLHIERGQRWTCHVDETQKELKIALPDMHEIGSDEVYVPAGPCWLGGDSHAPDSLPERRVCLPPFVIQRYPVTNREYLSFLNALVEQGREEEALEHCPRANRGTAASADTTLSYTRDASGMFHLPAHDPGEIWEPTGPVVLMTWHSAMAYARERSRVSGHSYRLPHEYEREKAVRGADGRNYPWGNSFDPTWACMLTSFEKAPGRVDVTSFPLDVSPYTVYGGAGNVRDFCLNRWESTWSRFSLDVPTDNSFRAVRGGAWSSVEHHCRAAARFANRPDDRRSAIGFRLARSYVKSDGS